MKKINPQLKRPCLVFRYQYLHYEFLKQFDNKQKALNFIKKSEGINFKIFVFKHDKTLDVFKTRSTLKITVKNKFCKECKNKSPYHLFNCSKVSNHPLK